MQKPGWYFHRLRSMSVPEIGWRLGRKARLPFDRLCVNGRRQIAIEDIIAPQSVGEAWVPRLGLGPVGVDDVVARPAELEAAFEALLRRADLVCDHRIDLFDMQACDLGRRINWNYEYKASKPTPLIFADDLDYRDYSEVGDCKFVWELNRHLHWVVLARAYRLTGERRYAEAIVCQFDSWSEQCPYGMGMNWRSPLELGIRLINWVWAFEWIRSAGLVDKSLGAKLLPLVHLHLWDITRNYSRYSSANNHLIGEAAGVYIASSAFPGLRKAAQWQAESRDILLKEIHSQTFADGGNKEQAMGYHLFVLEFFLLCGLVARKQGQEFPVDYWMRLQSMLAFLAAFMEGGKPQSFGDSDDGYVLDLGGGLNTYASQLLAVGATLFERSDWADLSGLGQERVWWLCGDEGLERFGQLCREHRPKPLRARAFPESGRYLLQSGHRQGNDQISVTFDCGELGFGSIAAHGHADALSVTVRLNGRDLLIDPGTYDYFTYRAWRDFFRSTRAHNTVVVDGMDQSEMLGLFLWGKRANSRCLHFEPAEQGGTVEGEHDGYMRLPNPVMHRRSVSLDPGRGCVTIADKLTGEGEHVAEFHLHFGPECKLERQGNCRFLIHVADDSAVLELSGITETELLIGSESPIMGWASSGYHRKASCPTLWARGGWCDHLDTEIKVFLGSGAAINA